MVLDKIHIKYPDALLEKVNRLKADGRHKLHIVSDFDRTLTKAFVGDRKILSTYAVLRDGSYLDEEYSKKDYELFDDYYHIENDPDIPDDVKAEKMAEWWKRHYDLMLEFGVTEKMIEDVTSAGRLVWRDNSLELFRVLRDNRIPILIFSAGIGNVIQKFMEWNQAVSDNVHIVSNFIEFDSAGRMKGFGRPLIHSYNKNEISIKGSRHSQEISQRKNVILIGDSIGDLGMAAGIEHDTIIKIGFLNRETDRNLPTYEAEFDVVILNDGPMDYVVDLVKDICKSSDDNST